MLVGAGHHVGAAADHRLQRARAAREVADAHVQALVLEVAQALGDGERQVVQRGLAADRDVHVALLDLRVRGRRRAASSGAKPMIFIMSSSYAGIY